MNHSFPKRALKNDLAGLKPVIERKWIHGQLVDVKVYPCPMDWWAEREARALHVRNSRRRKSA